MNTKRILIVVPITVLAIGGLFFAWVYLYFKNNPPHPEASIWTFRNNTTVPVGPFVNGEPFEIIRPNQQIRVIFDKPSKEVSEMVVRAYEFVPGEGLHFGWYDAESKMSVSGKLISTVASCKIYSWRDFDADEPVVIMEPKIEC